MNAARVVFYLVGAILVVLGLWMVFFEAGLNRWVPLGVAAAGFLLIIGLLIMGLGETGGVETTEVVHEEHHGGGDAH